MARTTQVESRDKVMQGIAIVGGTLPEAAGVGGEDIEHLKTAIEMRKLAYRDKAVARGGESDQNGPLLAP